MQEKAREALLKKTRRQLSISAYTNIMLPVFRLMIDCRQHAALKHG